MLFWTYEKRLCSLNRLHPRHYENENFLTYTSHKTSWSLCLRYKTWGSFLFRFPQQSHRLVIVIVNEGSTSSPANRIFPQIVWRLLTFFVFHSGDSLRCSCHLMYLTFHLRSHIGICTRVFHGLNSFINRTMHVSRDIRAYFYHTFSDLFQFAGPKILFYHRFCLLFCMFNMACSIIFGIGTCYFFLYIFCFFSRTVSSTYLFWELEVDHTLLRLQRTSVNAIFVVNSSLEEPTSKTQVALCNLHFIFFPVFSIVVEGLTFFLSVLDILRFRSPVLSA